MPNTGTAVALVATVKEAIMDEIKVSPYERQAKTSLIELYEISFGLDEPLSNPDDPMGLMSGNRV